MNQLLKYTLVLLILGSVQLLFSACLWDYDTLEMEREQFPSALELIAGNFLRHSPAFYYWRVKDRTAKLKENPKHFDWYDDLAVAYSKLGEQKKAIQLMHEKEELEGPSYKTYANLGTFYIFDGNLEAALKAIDQALLLDTNAHFGREIYQKYLVEYILSKSKEGKINLPLDATFYKYPQNYYSTLNDNNFYSFLLEKHKERTQKDVEKLPTDVLDKALIGVLGMMRFANYDSPILLEVLGDLLFNTGNRSAARHLAARAYLKASYEVEDPKVQEIYKRRAAYVLFTQYANEKKELLDIQRLQALLEEEIKIGQAFYEEIKSDELSWISAGENVEEAYSKKYYTKPTLPKRTLEGVSQQEFAEMRKYLKGNYPLGAQLDYRPVLAYKLEVTPQEKTLIDSLFERKLALQLKKKQEEQEIKQDSNTAKSSNTSLLLWGTVGGTIILLLILFLLKKNSRP